MYNAGGLQETGRSYHRAHHRHFVFSRVFFSSEGESKTSVTSETELFVILAKIESSKLTSLGVTFKISRRS